ncbi:hypothetical protein [Crocosphaera sp. Alani8]|uniref:hypothetical protein n=1 Tax=Crocosphaera sp. Alani8 TaxID=3038952 RepID=UPI00406D4DB1
MNSKTIQPLQEKDISKKTRWQTPVFVDFSLTKNCQFIANKFFVITFSSLLLMFILGSITYPIIIHHLSHLSSVSMTHSHHHHSMGLPLFSVGIVPMGVISIGIVPMGVICIGIIPMGLMSFGTVAMGLLSIGLVSMGAICSGLETMGLIKFQVSRSRKPEGKRLNWIGFHTPSNCGKSTDSEVLMDLI